MPRKNRKLNYAAPTDDPMDILAKAIQEANVDDRLSVRQAAEKAHLALSSAVEVGLRKSINSYSEELRGIKILAKRLRDNDLEKTFSRLRKSLHGDCFHGNKCPSKEEMLVQMGEARTIIRKLVAKPPKRNK